MMISPLWPLPDLGDGKLHVIAVPCAVTRPSYDYVLIVCRGPRLDEKLDEVSFPWPRATTWQALDRLELTQNDVLSRLYDVALAKDAVLDGYLDIPGRCLRLFKRNDDGTFVETEVLRKGERQDAG